jgi:hypothetical protein
MNKSKDKRKKWLIIHEHYCIKRHIKAKERNKSGTSDLIPSHFQGFFPIQFQGL